MCLKPSILRRCSAILFLFVVAGCEQQPYRMGERLYNIHCSHCHMDGGKGLGALIPPLKGSDFLVKHRDQLACIVRFGLADTIVVNGITYAEKMVANEQLNDIQIANVLNFVLQSWENDLPPLTFEEVEGRLQECGK